MMIKNEYDQSEDFQVYCERLSRKNNSTLYRLEKYTGLKLLQKEELKEIRDVILSVSGEISRLPSKISLGCGCNKKL
ncbi:hypothetical protein ABD71_25095 [Brevibacillus laterosporus]|uniref:Uncharacterized protein n=1 Tax=Brevibacillus laterosporus TaxID=1465 RepID=A0AAP8QGL3_BRELA|nr:hypothetical protein [Brevibacillus laterosporus]PPB12836.1 hypothetical protein C4A77_00180 [Brevibacillus laterosporus]